MKYFPESFSLLGILENKLASSCIGIIQISIEQDIILTALPSNIIVVCLFFALEYRCIDIQTLTNVHLITTLHLQNGISVHMVFFITNLEELLRSHTRYIRASNTSMA